MLWFMPALSLQPSLLPGYLGAVDLGLGTVGASGNIYRHLCNQLVFSNLPGTMAADVAQESASDLGLDPVSMLPMVLAYSLRPDDGAQTSIAIEIRYADYRVVN